MMDLVVRGRVVCPCLFYTSRCVTETGTDHGTRLFVLSTFGIKGSRQGSRPARVGDLIQRPDLPGRQT